jgi:hypothetical protein
VGIKEAESLESCWWDGVEKFQKLFLMGKTSSLYAPPFLFRAQLGWKRPGASRSSCLLPLVIMYVGHLLEFLKQQREMCDQKRVDITNPAFLCLAHKQVQSMRSGTFLWIASGWLKISV